MSNNPYDVNAIYEKTNTDAILEKFFPSLWSHIKGNIERIIPAITSDLLSENRMIKNRMEGLEVECFLNNQVNVRTYTLPYVSTMEGAQAVSFIYNFPNFNIASKNIPSLYNLYVLYAIRKLNSNPLKITSIENNRIKFNRSDIKILIWETRSTFQILDDDRLRFARILHEIGKWERTTSTAYNKLFEMLARTGENFSFMFINPLLLILSIFYARTSIYSADNFVKNAGYGKELAESLVRQERTIFKNTSLLIKIGGYITYVLNSIHNFIDKYAPFIYSNPSMHRRVKSLETDKLDWIAQANKKIINRDDDIIKEISYKEDIHSILNESFVMTQIENHIIRIIKPLDKVITKYSDMLFL